jgi:hypothetical protein
MSERSRGLLYAVIASYVSSILITAGGLVYMNHVDQESNRKWCKTVVTLDDAYSQTPPQSVVGKQIALSIHDLRTDFGC